MNQAQRKFLMDKIQKTSDDRLKLLRDSLPEQPRITRHLLMAVMSDTFELKSIEEIKEAIRKKAINGQGKKWGGSRRVFFEDNDDDVVFQAQEIFVVPEKWRIEHENWLKVSDEINKEMYSIRVQTETLLVRIQLASDKTLEKMIQEVDDMGNISLIETKLRLNEGAIEKALNPKSE